jgi:hypothetical protein
VNEVKRGIPGHIWKLSVIYLHTTQTPPTFDAGQKGARLFLFLFLTFFLSFFSPLHSSKDVCVCVCVFCSLPL